MRLVVARFRKADKLQFGEAKRLFQFTLTETVQTTIVEAAEELNVAHGTIVECVVRGGLSLSSPPQVRKSDLVELYGETKKRISYAITPEASRLISKVAKELEASRSETLESAIRNGAVEKAKMYYLKTFG